MELTVTKTRFDIYDSFISPIILHLGGKGEESKELNYYAKNYLPEKVNVTTAVQRLIGSSKQRMQEH